MSGRDVLGLLAAAARREDPPRVDVAERVLAAIATPPPRSDRIFLWMAVGSAATAAACVVLALPAWETLVDPLTQVMIALQGVAP